MVSTRVHASLEEHANHVLFSERAATRAKTSD